MSGDFNFAAKIVNPVKCNEKPWDLWVNEIGHSSPRRDEAAVVFVSPADAKGGGPARRVHDSHPYKVHPRCRRPGLNRLKHDTMSLHGLLPQMDNLNAAVCHMCGLIVKCTAAHRHLFESHSGSDPILPPPPPASTVKLKNLQNRNRIKKESAPPVPSVDILSIKMETSPVHTATAPLSRMVVTPSDLQYLEEASTSTAVTGEVQVRMESGELPVVSIQDTEDLPLNENITDDIIAIMDSEGIQSADDITNVADWKNIIRDLGNMREINFPQTTDPVQSQDLYTHIVDPSTLSAYAIADADLSSIQFAPKRSSMLSVVDTNILNAQALKPAVTMVTTVTTPTTPSTKSQSRSKTSKSKFNLREYDPNKHCGVVTADNPKPCTRSLTCKAHALSLRRTVEGRSKPFDILLAEHRAARDPASAAAVHPPLPASVMPPPAAAAPHNPPHLVNTTLSKDLTSFISNLTAEQQVNDIYAEILNAEDPNSIESSINSLLTQPLPVDSIFLPDDAELHAEAPSEVLPAPAAVSPAPSVALTAPRLDEMPDERPPLVPGDVCWYSSCPRPLALCTFNASHAGGAITLGKRFATVRSNIKSSLSRSQCKSSGNSNSFYYSQNPLSLSKSVHMNHNSSKTSKAEVRKLIVTCSATSGGGGGRDVQQTFGDLFSDGEVRHALNGHVGHARAPGHAERKGRSDSLNHKRPPSSMLMDLGFALDPLLAE